MVLTCKLKAKIDLLGGKSAEEVSNHEVNLQRWIRFTYFLNVLGFVCAQSLIIYVCINETKADGKLS